MTLIALNSSEFKRRYKIYLQHLEKANMCLIYNTCLNVFGREEVPATTKSKSRS